MKIHIDQVTKNYITPREFVEAQLFNAWRKKLIKKGAKNAR